MSLLVPASAASVLGMACGAGNYTSALAERGLTMVGVDISMNMLAKARTKPPFLPLVRADGNALRERFGLATLRRCRMSLVGSRRRREPGERC